MNRNTIDTLNEINRRFYAEQAPSFSETRSAAWPGWKELLPHIPSASEQPLSILDLGCGNGRFYGFLRQSLSQPLDYLGVDASPELLAIARNQYPETTPRQWLQADLLNDSFKGILNRKRWDLAVGFGLLHHIPSFEHRVGFVLDTAEQLSGLGLIFLTFWQFAGLDRFERKIVPWETYNARAGVSAEFEAIDLKELEPGDHLLSWGTGQESLRYCHFASPTELDVLAKRCGASGVHIHAEFSADGSRGDLNRYWVLGARQQPELTPPK